MSHRDKIASHIASCEAVFARISQKLSTILKSGRLYIEAAAIFTTVIAIAGVVLNNYKVAMCFKLWIASNLLSAIIHVYTGPWSFIVRDLIFLALAIQGMVLWH